MHEPDLTLTDIKRVTEAIRKHRSLDFEDYAFFPLKRSYEQCMIQNGMRDVDALLDRMFNDKHFMEEFIKDISIGSTEMFRDPSFWQLLKKNILPSLFNTFGNKLKVWFPYCVSGDELYSFLILLKENDWIEKVEVHVSAYSNLLLNAIKNGTFKQQKTTISTENYKNFEGKATLNNYIECRNSMVYRDVTLLKNVTFFQQSLNFSNSPSKLHLIIYRNKLIYTNLSLQEKNIDKLNECLIPGGILAIGAREQLEMSKESKFKCINQEESIYKKI